jgi:fibronectin type 3 domain-containing protein
MEELLEIQRFNRSYEERMAPTKPQDVKVQQVGINSVSITWKPPRVPWVNGQPVIEYEVLRREQENDFAGVLRIKTTNLSFLDNTAIRGKTYIYKVTGYTKNGRGGTAIAAPVQIP